jgi:hypothetical protein
VGDKLHEDEPDETDYYPTSQQKEVRVKIKNALKNYLGIVLKK